MNKFSLAFCLLVPIGICVSQTNIKGPSSSQNPYMLATIPSATMISILTVPDTIDGYVMAGPPDGQGAYSLNDSVFVVLMNHEISAGVGPVRAHGSNGAFVSEYHIRKKDFKVLSGGSLIKDVHIWTGTNYVVYNAANPSSAASLSRFCSADLPVVSAFYNSSSTLGTTTRILMNGEETSEGRAFAHIATGTQKGHSYHLPFLGRYAYENAVPCPFESDNTFIAGLDDSNPGQIYFYLGKKKNTGSDIEKAGLTGGQLYGLSVKNFAAEPNAALNFTTAPFTLIDLGDVTTMSGAALNQLSLDSGVTSFLRPEDGAWNPNSTNDFYFNTTNSYNGPSRLWRVRFTDISDPLKGGTITAVLDGSEGQKMLDNLDVTRNGNIYLQEDPGSTPYLARMFRYNISNDELSAVAQHDPSRFVSGGSQFLTENEESSGVLDMNDILGPGWLIFCVQAHYPIGGEAVEGGQLLAFYDSANNVLVPFYPTIIVTPRLYPNPASENVALSVDIEKDTEASLSIYNLTGEIVQNFSLVLHHGIQTLSFSTAELHPGTYILSFIAGDYSVNKKLIILR